MLLENKIAKSFQIDEWNNLNIFVNDHSIINYDGKFIGTFDTNISFNTDFEYDKSVESYLSLEEISKIIDNYNEDDIINFVKNKNFSNLIDIFEIQNSDIDF